MPKVTPLQLLCETGASDLTCWSSRFLPECETTITTQRRLVLRIERAEMSVLVIHLSPNKSSKSERLKTANLYDLTVSMGQECGSGLARWFLFRILLDSWNVGRAVVSEGPAGAGDLLSKRAPSRGCGQAAPVCTRWVAPDRAADFPQQLFREHPRIFCNLISETSAVFYRSHRPTLVPHMGGVC